MEIDNINIVGMDRQWWSWRTSMYPSTFSFWFFVLISNTWSGLSMALVYILNYIY